MIRRLWTLADGWGQQMGQRSEPPSAHSAARRGRSRRQRATVRGRGGGATAPSQPAILWPRAIFGPSMRSRSRCGSATTPPPSPCRRTYICCRRLAERRPLPRTSLPRRLAARSQAPLMTCLTPNLEQPSRRPATSSNLDQCGDSDPSCPPGGVASTAADCGAPVASIRQPTCSRTASAKRTRSRWRTVRQISTCASDWCFGP